MASIARQRGIEVYETAAEALPFADESFDSVLIVTAICFIAIAIIGVNEPLSHLRARCVVRA
jgi:hypothetical protein